MFRVQGDRGYFGDCLRLREKNMLDSVGLLYYNASMHLHKEGELC